MIDYSVIQKSQLEGAHRLDAEYFSPEYLEVEKRLSSIKTTTVGEISESVVNFGAYSLCNYITWRESGISYLNVENIKDGYLGKTTSKHPYHSAIQAFIRRYQIFAFYQKIFPIE